MRFNDINALNINFHGIS